MFNLALNMPYLSLIKYKLLSLEFEITKKLLISFNDLFRNLVYFLSPFPKVLFHVRLSKRRICYYHFVYQSHIFSFLLLNFLTFFSLFLISLCCFLSAVFSE